MSIQDTIIWVMEHGELTLSDVSVWLKSPLPTVRSWVVYGRQPRERRVKPIEFRLAKLKELILVNGPLVPEEISEHHRAEYIKGKSDEHCGRLPKKDLANERQVLSGSVLQE